MSLPRGRGYKASASAFSRTLKKSYQWSFPLLRPQPPYSATGETYPCPGERPRNSMPRLSSRPGKDCLPPPFRQHSDRMKDHSTLLLLICPTRSPYRCYTGGFPPLNSKSGLVAFPRFAPAAIPDPDLDSSASAASIAPPIWRLLLACCDLSATPYVWDFVHFGPPLARRSAAAFHRYPCFVAPTLPAYLSTLSKALH